MGQQPNIPVGLTDLPRPTAHPDPPRRWRPDRPGELHSPEDVPWGGAFGTPGPDAGYALKLIHQRGHEHLVEGPLVALVVVRASHYGRAPVIQDLEVAEVLTGHHGDLDAGVAGRLRTEFAERTAGASHDPARLRAFVAAVDPELLVEPFDHAMAGVASGRPVYIA